MVSACRTQRRQRTVPFPEPLAHALGDSLRQHRGAQGLTQEDLAQSSADLHVQMVRRLEAGTANPTLGTLHAVTTALDLAWTDLFIELQP